MNIRPLIDGIVQATTALIAHLATVSGTRAPLATLVDQVFKELVVELEACGVRKRVIADMFGMALRTYHRRMQNLTQSLSIEGRTVWEAVVDYLGEHGETGQVDVLTRFRYDDEAIVRGVLNDLVVSGLAVRAGRGNDARFQLVEEAELDHSPGSGTHAALVWMVIYREGPVADSALRQRIPLRDQVVDTALEQLLGEGRIRKEEGDDESIWASDKLEVPIGSPVGWEAAILDHYQSVVSMICQKLQVGPARSYAKDVVGGSTYSIDVWPGHPMWGETVSMLAKVREMIGSHRQAVDKLNEELERPQDCERVVFYMGQYISELGEED